MNYSLGNMASSDDDVTKYLFKVADDHPTMRGFTNPIAKYMLENSVREPDILRRLQEVYCT